MDGIQPLTARALFTQQVLLLIHQLETSHSMQNGLAIHIQSHLVAMAIQVVLLQISRSPAVHHSQLLQMLLCARDIPSMVGRKPTQQQQLTMPMDLPRLSTGTRLFMRYGSQMCTQLPTIQTVLHLQLQLSHKPLLLVRFPLHLF